MTGQTSAMKIIKPGAKPSNEAPSEYFTGAVRVTPLVKGESPSYLTCASGGFQPGARSAWHTHPKGQLLALAGWCHPLRRSGIMATRRLFRHRSEARVKLVRAEGLEPSRTLRSNGFSCPLRLSPPLHSCRRVWGLDYPFTMSRISSGGSGAARLVSTPSRPFRAGLGSGSPYYRVPRI